MLIECGMPSKDKVKKCYKCTKHNLRGSLAVYEVSHCGFNKKTNSSKASGPTLNLP